MSARVTSFKPSGYDLYGKAFIESFVKWVELPLVVHVGGEDNVLDLSHALIQYKDLFSARGMLDVLNWTNLHAAKGRIWGDEEADYLFNVHRFCRKSFAQIDMAHQMASKGRLIFSGWMLILFSKIRSNFHHWAMILWSISDGVAATVVPPWSGRISIF